MNLFDLPVEVTVSIVVISTIATTGCIAALHSWTRITAERKGIIDAEAKLISDDAWNDAYPHDKLKLATWLRQIGIKPDSHLGDFIRTCWSAWLGGRPASLTELHVLVARRERSHKATRLSAGIAALLLVCGIVGTLSAIKPVLREFRLTQDDWKPTTEAVQPPISAANSGAVDASSEQVYKLMRDLGDAFWPSLGALLGTILVVTCRGVYSLSLHKFTLELDRFAVDTLIPRYRVPTLSEQYQEVKTTLASVTECMAQREERFLSAVEHLEKLVIGISPALSGLAEAATSAKEATESLSSGATSITEALSRNLGAKSPIHRAVRGLDSVFENTEKSLGNLSSILEGIGKSNVTSQEKLESAIQTLCQSIEKIGRDHQSLQSANTKALKDFKESLEDIPTAIESTGEKAVEAGLTTVKARIEELRAEQKKWHAASADDLKSATTAGLAGVTKAGQDLAAHAENVATAATDIRRSNSDISAALKGLTESGKSQISKIGDATKSMIESAAAKLSEEAERIGRSIEIIGKPQLGPSSPADPSELEATESNAPARSDFGRNQESIVDEVLPPSTTVFTTTPESSAVIMPTPTGNHYTENPAPANAESPQASNLEEMHQRLPPPTVQPTGPLAGNATHPTPEKIKKKWWNPFSG